MRRGRMLWAGVVTVASAATYAALRVPMANEAYRSYAALCERVQMRPQDWPCRASRADAMLAVLGGSLGIWLGLALAVAVVAWSGRRVAWLVPLLPLIVFPLGVSAVLAWWDGSSRPGAMVPLLGQAAPWSFGGSPTFWEQHWELAAVVDLALVSLPALAVVLLLRPAKLERKPPVWAFRTALWAGAGAAAVVTRAAVETGLLVGNAEDAIMPVVTIGLVGVLAGHRRGWLPWALVPTAVLLSGGLTAWSLGSLGHLVYLGRFGAVVPLAVVGFLGSLVPPFAWWLTPRRRAPAVDQAASPAPPPPLVRPAAVALAVSLGLLGASAIMRANDPAPIQISTELPTYLGVREAVEAGLPYPVGSMCDGADDQVIVLCRAVQLAIGRLPVGGSVGDPSP